MGQQTSLSMPRRLIRKFRVLFVYLVFLLLVLSPVLFWLGRDGQNSDSPLLVVVKKIGDINSNDFSDAKTGMWAMSHSRTPSPLMADFSTSKRDENINVCKIPKMDLKDDSLANFFHKPWPLQCRKEQNWVKIENGIFIVDPEAKKWYGIIDCNYVHFWRETDYTNGMKEYKGFKSGSKVKGDFAKVHCSTKDFFSFQNVYATIVPSPKAIARARTIAKEPRNKHVLGINVMILGLDSMSRLGFMRQLPKTHGFLTETLKAVVLKGYNIVGDGTPQAFIPILTGQTEVELPLTRKSFSSFDSKGRHLSYTGTVGQRSGTKDLGMDVRAERRTNNRYPNAQFCDVYPMIWRDFENAGYVTQYGEDASHLGTFNYRLKGFDSQPTDHYLRAFYSVAESEYRKHAPFCLGSEPRHNVFWRYAEEFLDNYPEDVWKFSLMHHSELSHDDINKVEVADGDYQKFLERLLEKGHLNRTLLIVMGDHGHRFAQFRATQQGQLEERLPYFAFVAPEWFKTQYKEEWTNLVKNVDRLTTPFDIHSTLKALLHWRTNKLLNRKSAQTSQKSNRSLSLWEEVPISRTCAQAGVEPHWCVCLNWETVSAADNHSITLANAVVQTINSETQKERKLCAELKLAGVESAKRLAPHELLLKYKNAQDVDGFVPNLGSSAPVTHAVYQLRFRTKPGNALYEATVVSDQRTSRQKVVVDLDDVSHVNQYGDAPHCVIDRDYFLIKWCVCYDRI